MILFIVALHPAKGGSFLRNDWLKTPLKWLNSAAIITNGKLNKFRHYIKASSGSPLYIKKSLPLIIKSLPMALN